jgi:hypothetical protein
MLTKLDPINRRRLLAAAGLERLSNASRPGAKGGLEVEMMADQTSRRSRSLAAQGVPALPAALLDARRLARAAMSLLLVCAILLLPHARLGHAANAVDALSHDLAIICTPGSGLASNLDSTIEAPTALPEHGGERAHCPLCLGGAAPPFHEPSTVAPVRWATLVDSYFVPSALPPFLSGAGVPGRPRGPPQPF